MVRIILLIFIFFYSFQLQSEELSTQEIVIFNFIDLNKDKNISNEEANKLIDLLFKLIDKNQDGNISKLEIKELKYIIESLT